jgi:hypothetical protein
VVWNQKDLVEVGGLTVITIKLTCANGKPYCLQPSDEFTCKVTKSIGKTTLICVVEPAELTGVSEVKVTYTARAVGKYCIKLTVNDLNIGDSPYERTYLPGPADCSKTIVLSNSNTMVARRGVYNAVSVEAKDAHGNSTVMDLPKLDMVVTQNESDQFALETELVRSQQDEEYELLFKLEQDGIYFGKVMYESKMVGTEGFTIICLDESAVDLVEKQVQKRELNNWYEARLLPQEPSEKGRTVYCYITPWQLQVREYFLYYFLKRRVYTCRIRPSTKIHFLKGNAFCIDDGYQEPITLVSEERGVIGATFSKYMLKNIGGTENFQSKRDFFYKKVSSLGSRVFGRTVKIYVRRSDLFHTAYRALETLSASDWMSKFEVVFVGEPGLDWGGVRREFFTLLCCELFESSGLFTRFSEDHQALVHPNPNRPSSLKLKYYEFCGKVIGKCLYDSALGDIILVKARFTRSFLAQIIGLRVNYRYFETDDPELYTTKVKYVKESDVSDFELTFTEEVVSPSTGSVTEVVSLKPGGASIEVTNENKMEYLNCLAQYRLVYRVKDEIEAFLKGLNEIIPDNLLSIFDENELELLMCGMSKIDVSDWKAHSTVNGHNAHFLTMVTWFWTVVTNYNQEERTRILQFVTGSSQLPSEGFSELNPKFTISHAPVPGRLPSAHTCFNEICLSDHTTYESFESSLRIAITEGSEGFGMA